MMRIVNKLIAKSGHKWAHHGVIVKRGGNIIATGFNKDYLHAEVSALNKLWPSERKDVVVYSYRVTRSGFLACAKPCPNCEQHLRDNGVKKVYFTNDFGELEMMRL